MRAPRSETAPARAVWAGVFGSPAEAEAAYGRVRKSVPLGHAKVEPVLRTNNREIVAARFVEPRALLAEPVLPPFIRAYLREQRPVDRRRPPAGA